MPTPEAPAVDTLGGHQISFGQFVSTSNRVVHGLRSLGVQRGDPPALLVRLREDRRRSADLGALRRVIPSGAPCPVDVKRAVLDWLGSIVWEVYGTTEGTATVASPEDWNARPGHGRTGEPGWRACYLDSDGYLFLTGGSADVINLAGLNVYAAEVEEVIRRHPEVCDVAVIGISSRQTGEEVMAVVELEPSSQPVPRLTAELAALCREHVAPHKRPVSTEYQERD